LKFKVKKFQISFGYKLNTKAFRLSMRYNPEEEKQIKVFAYIINIMIIQQKLKTSHENIEN